MSEPLSTKVSYPAGESVIRERVIRVRYPDGTVRDSSLMVVFKPRQIGKSVRDLTDMVARKQGCTVTWLERTVTISASEWEEVEPE